MAASERRHITVLCVACSARTLAWLRDVLNHSRIQILSAANREQAVALCVAHSVTLALIDGESIRGEELSLAEALKIVRPLLPVFLLDERNRPGADLPQNVDAGVPIEAPEELLTKIEELLNNP